MSGGLVVVLCAAATDRSNRIYRLFVLLLGLLLDALEEVRGHGLRAPYLLLTIHLFATVLQLLLVGRGVPLLRVLDLVGHAVVEHAGW